MPEWSDRDLAILHAALDVHAAFSTISPETLARLDQCPATSTLPMPRLLLDTLLVLRQRIEERDDA